MANMERKYKNALETSQSILQIEPKRSTIVITRNKIYPKDATVQAIQI
jgi:hypothetical protein